MFSKDYFEKSRLSINLNSLINFDSNANTLIRYVCPKAQLIYNHPAICAKYFKFSDFLRLTLQNHCRKYNRRNFAVSSIICENHLALFNYLFHSMRNNNVNRHTACGCIANSVLKMSHSDDKNRLINYLLSKQTTNRHV